MKPAGNQDRVFIPLAIKPRNGRAKIVAPAMEAQFQSRKQDPHILKALGRAWAWRRKLESGEAATIYDIAKAEQVTDRFVSRIMRFAYLSPELLDKLVLWQEPCPLSLNNLAKISYLPWAEQVGRVFDRKIIPE